MGMADPVADDFGGQLRGEVLTGGFNFLFCSWKSGEYIIGFDIFFMYELRCDVEVGEADPGRAQEADEGVDIVGFAEGGEE